MTFPLKVTWAGVEGMIYKRPYLDILKTFDQLLKLSDSKEVDFDTY